VTDVTRGRASSAFGILLTLLSSRRRRVASVLSSREPPPRAAGYSVYLYSRITDNRGMVNLK
jgi:hypothetical protein